MTKMIAMKPLRYGTRNLVAGDIFDAEPRYARTLRAIRKAKDAPIEVVPEVPPIVAVRAEYEDVLGKKPFHGWDEDMLRRKMAEFREEDD